MKAELSTRVLRIIVCPQNVKTPVMNRDSQVADLNLLAYITTHQERATVMMQEKQKIKYQLASRSQCSEII